MSTSKEHIADNIARVRARIEAAARESGRSADDITLIAVSKFQPLELIREAYACGAHVFGENRVQERAEKAAGWTEVGAVWNMIGHLQRNKARRAVELFDCIQSIDGAELASLVERAARDRGVASYPIMVEINTSGEASKSGAAPDGALSLIEHITANCPTLSVDGLMTIGPLTDDERRVRASFASLRELAVRARAEFGLAIPHLSMGMSGDFELAIAEGSTMVRVGTSIFGARDV